MKKHSTPVQAVILAGGQGSRLRPYTTVIPKPLMPLDDQPIIEIIIKQLKQHKIENIVISTGYKSHLIEAYIGDGRQWGVNIRYIREEKPLGTAGALKLLDHASDDFLTINGDVLTNIDFGRLLDVHKRRRAFATAAVFARAVVTDFGVVAFNKDQELTGYVEKPRQTLHVSMGVNVFSARAGDLIKRGEMIGMPDLLLRARAKGEKVCCFPHKGAWLDLGRLDDLETAQGYWKRNRKKFLSAAL